MNENEPVAKKNHTSSAPRGGPRQKIIRRTFDERLRAVKLLLQEGFARELIAQEIGVSAQTGFLPQLTAANSAAAICLG